MIAKAIALLHRWLAHDDENLDETLDDETNDLLLAYSVPRAEYDQAVLDAMGGFTEGDLQDAVDAAIGDDCREARLAFALCSAEIARRQAKAKADAARREMLAVGPELRERARAAVRRLASLR